MAHYDDIREQCGTDGGFKLDFNLDYDKSLAQNIIVKLSMEKQGLEWQLSIKDAKIRELESLVMDLYRKIDVLINEADTGEEI